jgi:predicted amidophosphoribosyltransferase
VPSTGSSIVLRRLLRELEATALDAVAPPRCASCGSLGHELCPPCRAGLEWRAGGHTCARCGEPLSTPQQPCPGRHDRITGFAVARAPWRYRGTGGRIVRRFKFDGEPGALRWMVRAAGAAIQEFVATRGRRALFVAVPMHPRKRRARGHDHAARLAEEIARSVERPFVPGALRRVRDTLPQGDPRVTNRATNVEGAFTVARPHALRGRAVVLVDDVTTSGSTARACARVLREANAGPLALLTVAIG